MYWRLSSNGGIRTETDQIIHAPCHDQAMYIDSIVSAVCQENARNREMTCVRESTLTRPRSMEWARSRFDLIVKTLWPLMKPEQVAIKDPTNLLNTLNL